MVDTDVAGPRQDHARRAVVSFAGFWGLGVVSAQLVGSALGIAFHLAAMACGFVFFYAVAQIAAEGAGLRPLDYWTGVPGHRRVPTRERWRLTGSLLRPTWWRGLLGATGWPTPIVALTLAITFVASIASLATAFTPLHT